MINLITFFILGAIGYAITFIIRRKQKELVDKELRQKEQFLKDTQYLLQVESHSLAKPTVSKTLNNSYQADISEYFTAKGYTLTNGVKVEGIDFIGVKEKELLIIRCDENSKEVRRNDLKIFIAECCIYIDNNPMLSGRSIQRIYATKRPVTEEALAFIRDFPSSLHLLEI
jgi:hypothetical protein